MEKAVGKEEFRISDKLVERLDAEENIPLEQVIQIAEEESIEVMILGIKCPFWQVSGGRPMSTAM